MSDVLKLLEGYGPTPVPAQAAPRRDLMSMLEDYGPATLGDEIAAPFKALAAGAMHGTAGLMEGQALVSEQIPDPLGIKRLGLLDVARGLAGGLRSAAPEVHPELADSFLLSDVPGALGSTVPFAAAGLVGGGLGIAPALTAGYAGAVTNGAQEFYTHLRAKPGDEEGAWVAFAAGGAGGAAEGLPIGRILNRVNKASNGTLKQAITAAFVEGLEEGAQETSQQVISNLIAEHLRDEDVEPLEGVLRSGGAGALSGVLLSALGSRMSRSIEQESSKSGQDHLDQPPDLTAEGPAPVDPDAPPDLEATASLAPGSASLEAPTAPTGPDTASRAAAERLLRENVVRGHLTPEEAQAARVVEATDPDDIFNEELAGQVGRKLVMVDAGKSLPLHGAFLEEMGAFVLDARLPAGERRRAVLAHELLHDLRTREDGSETPWEDLYGEIAQLDPEGLQAATAFARGSQEAAGVQGFDAREEGLSYYAEGLQGWMSEVMTQPERLEAVLEGADRGLVTRILDAVVRLLRRAGFTVQDSRARALRALQNEVAGGLDMNPETAARAALAIREAFDGMVGARGAQADAQAEPAFSVDPREARRLNRLAAAIDAAYERGEGERAERWEGLLAEMQERIGTREEALEEGDPNISEHDSRSIEEMLIHSYESMTAGVQPGMYSESDIAGNMRDALETAAFSMGGLSSRVSDADLLALGRELSEQRQVFRQARRARMSAAEDEEIPFAAAWHGGPHDFLPETLIEDASGKQRFVLSSDVPDGARVIREYPLGRFRSDKIGTGEGAQAYGHGLYYGSRREVGEHYRDALSNTDHPRLDGKPIPLASVAWTDWYTAARNRAYQDNRRPVSIEDYRATVGAARAVVEAELERHESAGPMPVAGQELMRTNGIKSLQAQLAALDRVAAGEGRVGDGRLYQVNLAPEEDEYLLWDEPLSGQSEKVRAALDGLPEGILRQYPMDPESATDNPTGREAYERLSRIQRGDSTESHWETTRESDRLASQALLSAGIRGIKYLDGSSRNRPLRQIKREFLDALPEDADFRDVMEQVEAGGFKPEHERVLRALNAEDWLGFDYPSQAISAALTELSNFDASQELTDAVTELRQDGTYNYVIFDDRDVEIEAKFSAAPPVDSPEFKRWFKLSPVTEDRKPGGVPLVVHHYGYFDENEADGAPTVGPEGMHFGTRSAAEERAATKSTDDMIRAGEVYEEDGGWFWESEGLSSYDLNPEGFPSQWEARRDMEQTAVSMGEMQDEVGGSFTSAYLSIQNPMRVPDQGGNWTEAVKKAKAAGHDGLVYNNRYEDKGSTSYVVFRPEQVKSVANRGTFDPTNPDIRFSAADPTNYDGFSVPNQTFRSRMMSNWVDKLQRVVETQQAIGEITEDLDVVAMARVFEPKVAAKVEDMERRYWKPIAQLLRNLKATYEQYSEYLVARHAPDRNEHHHRQNPEKWGIESNPGSGMRTSKAREIVAAREAENPAWKRLGALVDKMNSERLDIAQEFGLESAETLAGWRERFGPHYVPLRTDMSDVQPTTRPGRGFSIPKGPISKRARGRSSMADDPLGFSFQQYMETVFQAGRNEVWETLAKQVEAHPNPEFWGIEPLPEPEVGEDGIPRNVMDPRYKLDPERAVSGKRNGKPYSVRLADKALAKALNGMGVDKAPGAIRFLGKVTRTFSKLVTAWDPEFMVGNFARDTTMAGATLTGEQRAALAARVMKGIPAAMKATYRVLGDHDAQGTYEDAFRNMEKAGGFIAWFYQPTLEEHRRTLEREIRGFDPKNPKTLLRALTRFGEAVERVNKSVENAVRLSTYVEFRKDGASELEAANAARGVTVDFNRRGFYSTWANSLYAFFNASTQGVARFLWSVGKHKKVRAVVGTWAAASFVLDMYNRAIAGDDDDGENRYDKVPEYIKDRNFVLMLPKGQSFTSPFSGEEVPYLHLPLPYGFNIVHTFGRNLAAALSGAVKPMEAAGNVVSSAWGAMSPIGSEATATQVLSPTITDPLVQISENKTFFGGPITKTRFPGDTRPDSELYFDNVSKPSRVMTKFLNEATGGDKYKPGLVDISPETVDHVWDFVSGGPGKLARRTGKTFEWLQGGTVDDKDIPFWRKVVGQMPRGQTSRSFREKLDRLKRDKLRIEEGLLQVSATEYGRLQQVLEAFKAADRRAKKLQEAAAAAADTEQRKSYERQREALQARLIRMFNETGEIPTLVNK